ncbi:uncharacterized protein DUF4878 [Algoriphagus ratkowskyi]|uniref:DUF4878 domain-containing protein n=1 Tax=Algoriphagus ratkowskyi TaxID=57028 RepID=A0A2W7RG28_9BACT|nr:DUF4878 domain-containing protein [Algoriphagus ratkowskyi]PZX59374.1 uncharacterized protein DUF4878 [Algoriphagus ratkowskyi]TXD77362.1 DUF4878 domain-containing protein [Algoriphagus ratkowskyi]
MKKLLTILCLATLLFSCSSGPEDSVKNFTENLAKGKVEEAKKYATEPTGKLLDMVSSMGKIPIEPDFKFEILNDSIVGNRAWITISNPNGRTEVIEAVKIDGDWLVHMEAKF